MSNIDKRALREAAEKATPGPWEMEQENIWFTDAEGYTKHLIYVQQGDDVDDKQDHYNTAFIAEANPATILALLDELEAAESRIAELSHHLQCAHGFIEHTEAFGHEASNGILCCGDAQWDIDASKSALAAAAKGE